MIKAYICHCDANKIALGPSVGLDPNAKFCVGDTNMLVSKNPKICVTPNANFKIVLAPTQNPNASQWNIGCVGSQTHISCIGVGSHFSVKYGLNSFLL